MTSEYRSQKSEYRSQKSEVLFCLLYSVFCLLFFACVPPPARTPPAIEPAVSKPPPVIINPFKPFLEEHIKRASSLEQQGNISGAAEEFKIALTIDPSNNEAKEGLRRLSDMADKETERHFQKGLSLKKTDPSKARIEFLTALRIKPDYQPAIDELKENHLLVAKSRLLAPSGEADTGVEDYLSVALSLYEDGDYAGAIQEFLKAKEKYPKNPEITKHLNFSYYKQGIALFEKGEYKESLRMFSNLQPNFEKAGEYLKKVRAELKKMGEDYYKNGLKLFREQKLNQAIEQWNMALEIEPEHKKAREYIEKAKNLLKSLEQLK
ncbi:MAG: tetratricopeptide repeat protein [Nitrospinae bacterium]|nr:tetratricopeptide repeat protein [Nitrospinota bacterium]